MAELAADLVFVLHLLNETEIFLRLPHDVFEREDLPGGGVLHEVDDTSRTLSQTLQDIIVEELLSHEFLFHRQGVSVAPEWWGIGHDNWHAVDNSIDDLQPLLNQTQPRNVTASVRLG
jgi:hypothetical protein